MLNQIVCNSFRSLITLQLVLRMSNFVVAESWNGQKKKNLVHFHWPFDVIVVADTANCWKSILPLEWTAYRIPLEQSFVYFPSFHRAQSIANICIKFIPKFWFHAARGAFVHPSSNSIRKRNVHVKIPCFSDVPSSKLLLL